ncbi:MAG: hypothetical protein L3J35_04710 [Bacteroidales bacterium]|nr:hypothetical protein [Bacteroidales bacterium]
MAEKLAKFLSFIFHPLLLPTFAIILMFFFPSYLSHYQYAYKKAIVLVVFLSTFISPLLVMLILLNLRVISDISLPDRKERYYPFAIVTMIYITAYFITVNLPLGIPSNISEFVLMSSVIILFVLFVNLKIKVSVHMAGIGGFLGFFYVFFLKESLNEVLFTFMNFEFTAVYFFSILILIAGITATARLILKAHTFKEIGLGFFLGLSVSIVTAFLI